MQLSGKGEVQPSPQFGLEKPFPENHWVLLAF